MSSRSSRDSSGKPDGVTAVAHRLRKAVIRPISVAGVARFIGANIGANIGAGQRLLAAIIEIGQLGLKVVSVGIGDEPGLGLLHRSGPTPHGYRLARLMGSDALRLVLNLDPHGRTPVSNDPDTLGCHT